MFDNIKLEHTYWTLLCNHLDTKVWNRILNMYLSKILCTLQNTISKSNDTLWFMKGKITVNNMNFNWFFYNNTNFRLILNNTKFNFIFPPASLFTFKWLRQSFYSLFFKELSNKVFYSHSLLFSLTLF